MKWSVDGQTPEFLALSRMATLSPEIMDTIAKHVRPRAGMKVLDVGCGSGEYTFRLAERCKDVHFTGVDFDENFIAAANAHLAHDEGVLFPVSPENSYRFIQADGLALPFEDDSFDMVVSHTYLTALPDYTNALREMCRVCKPGGTVSSITAMHDAYDGTGQMDLFGPVLPAEDAEIINTVREAIAKKTPVMPMGSGISPRKAPLVFSRMGLEDVHAAPLGQYFSLSDSRLPAEQYRRHVQLLHACELQAARYAEDLPALEGGAEPSPTAWKAYAEALDRRRDYLLSVQRENTEWNWFGSAALLVAGTVPQADFHLPPKEAEARREGKALERMLLREEGSIPVGITRQTNRGTACAVQIKGSFPACAAGFSPARATEAAYRLAATRACESQELHAKPDATASGLHAVSAGSSACKAKVEAFCCVLEQLARQKLQEETPVPPQAHDQQVYAVEGVYDTVYDALAEGDAVRFFDLSFGMGIPAMACVVEAAGECRTGIAAYPELSETVQRCCARALGGEGTPGRLFSTEGAASWEAPWWADDAVDVEEGWQRLQQTFEALGWQADACTAAHESGAAVCRAALTL